MVLESFRDGIPLLEVQRIMLFLDASCISRRTEYCQGIISEEQ